MADQASPFMRRDELKESIRCQTGLGSVPRRLASFLAAFNSRRISRLGAGLKSRRGRLTPTHGPSGPEMSRGKHTFKQGDLTKAVKGVVNAGLSVTRVEADTKSGKIIVFTGPGGDAPSVNEWDNVR
jgi:hypothetical protein